MKIVLACDTFAPDINGAARFAERLAGGLVRNGHEVHIIAAAFDDTEGPRIENHDGVNMIVALFKEEMENLLATMHQDMQLLFTVFMIVVLSIS